MLEAVNVLDLDELPHVIVRGNLSDGYDIVGPFNGWDAALKYEEHFIQFESTWIMPLVEPFVDK